MNAKKKNIIIFLVVIAYILPGSVFAETYNYPDDVKNLLYGPDNQNVVEFLPGDEIVFNIDEGNVYIDGVKASDECYGLSCSRNIYTVTKKMYFSYEKAWSKKIDFVTNEDGNSTYLYSNAMNGKYYKSGDLIVFKGLDYYSSGINPRIYDKEDNLLYYYNTFAFAFDNFYSYDGQEQGYFLMKLPKVEEKDTYWKVSILNDGSYGYPSPHFTPFDYSEPIVELKCDKDEINYGEKTRCEVCLECSSKMRKLNFLINHNNLKLSNISYLEGVTNSSDDNQTINLSFGANSNFLEKRVIMTFDVEGTKNSTYLDNISLGNIEYTDEVVTAKYNNLNSDLNIISTKPLTNPETGIKALFVVIPILILLIVSGMSTIRKKKYEK